MHAAVLRKQTDQKKSCWSKGTMLTGMVSGWKKAVDEKDGKVCEFRWGSWLGSAIRQS